MFRASEIYGAPPGPRGPAASAAASKAAASAAVSKAAAIAPVAATAQVEALPGPGPGKAFGSWAGPEFPPCPQPLHVQVPCLPSPQQAAAALVAAASGRAGRAGGGVGAAARSALPVAASACSGTGADGGVPFFEAAACFAGARPGRVFKLGHLGLGYYLDGTQTLLHEVRPKIPERWRDVQLREERLRVDPQTGAGLSLEHSEFGFAVEAVDAVPGQQIRPGEVIVAMEGRMLAGLSAPQMQASFQKRRADGARLQVASLAEAKDLAARDPAVVECWDARQQRVYYFHKRTAKTAWTREELQLAPEQAQMAEQAAHEATPGAVPVDLASFLSHGFAKPKEQPPKKKRKAPAAETSAEKDISDLAREERKRWNDWNEGGRGGYTDQFLTRYKNCTSYPTKSKPDKRLKGSVGPGQGMEYMARWTGSKNSFN